MRGVVRDTLTGQPVGMANVTLRTLPDSGIVAFAMSKTSGEYRLACSQCSTGTYFASVSHVSYATQNRPILPTGSEQILDFYLTEKETELLEVKVNARRPVRIRGDSTIYKVSNYAQSGENTLEDVLRKLPNLQVSDKGEIFFKGKPVDKILLDGDDLIGSNYQLTTRSLTPALIDEIQAIERYSDNALLRGIENSDKVAINLSLKNAQKAKLLGSAGIGLGNKTKRDLTANVVGKWAGQKAYALASHNNVGLRRNEFSIFPKESLNYNEFFAPLSDFSVFWNQTGDNFRILNSPLLNFNNEQSYGLNLALTPVKKLKVVVNGLASRETVLSVRNGTIEYLGAVNFINSVADSVRMAPAMRHLKVQADYALNDRSRLRYLALADERTLPMTRQQYLSASRDWQQYNQRNTARFQTFRQQLEFTRKISEKAAFQAQVHYTKLRNQQDLLADLDPVFYNRFYGNLPNQAANPVLGQRISPQLSYWSGQAQWLRRTENGKIGYFAGFNNGGFSNLTTVEAAGVAQAVPIELQMRQLYAGQDFDLSWRKLRWKHVVQLQHYTSRAEDSAQRSQYFLQFSGNLSFPLSSLAGLALNYTQKASPLSLQYLNGQLLMQDFRTAVQGSDSVLFNRERKASVSYYFDDILGKNLFFMTSVFGSKSPSNWSMMDNTLDPHFLVNRIFYTNKNTYLGSTSRLDMLVYPIRGNIRLEMTALSSLSEGRVNASRKLFENRSIEGRFYYESAFKFPFNFSTEWYYQYSQFDTRGNDQAFRQSLVQGKQEIACWLKIRDNLGKLTASRYVVLDTANTIVRLENTYTFNPRFSVKVEANNLLNSGGIKRASQQPTLRSESVYPLLSRFFLVTMRVST